MDGMTILRNGMTSKYVMPTCIEGCICTVEYLAKDGAYVFHLDENGKLWQEQSNRDNLRDI